MHDAKAEESLNKHNSREHNITLGMETMHIFFRFVQVKWIANKITCVRDAQGNLLEKGEDIS